MPKHTPHPLTGLVPAVLTPFDSHGELNLPMVEKQAELLLGDGISAVFVGGTTGEFSSLTIDERLSLTKRWCDVAKGSAFRVVVHVGSNCLKDSMSLVRHAAEAGAAAIATVASNYFKPKTTHDLVEWCAAIGSAAPATPLYFYDIPSMTGVSLPMPEFLDSASERIPSLAGLKFTNPDLMTFQQLLHLKNGRFDVLWGLDEFLLAALALGAEGAVGATYNFAAPMYQRIFDAVKRCDLAAARVDQFRSVELIGLMIRYGFLTSAKEAMRMRGLDLGTGRLPNVNLNADKAREFRAEFERLGITRR